MKHNTFLGIILGLILSFASVAYAVNISVPQSTAFGDILRGNANGTYSTVATSSLGITGNVSTSTVPTIGQLPYWTGNGTPSLLGSVATTTLTLSNFPASIPSTLGSLVGGSNTTWTWWGLSTTSQPASSNLLVSNGGAGVFGVATSTLTPTSAFTITGTLGTLVGGGSATLDIANNGVSLGKLAQITANTILGNPTGGTANVQAFATSTLGIALSDTTGTLAVLRGGTGQTSFTSGTLLYGAGTGAVQSVATSSIALGTGLSYSGTLGALVGGANGTLSLSGVAPSSISLAKGNFLVGNDAGTAQATSTIFISSTGNVGIGTTSPAQLLSIGNGVASGGLYYSATGLAVGSSTPAFPFSIGSNFYISSTGEIVGYDATNAWSGRISPTRSFVLSTGTTTTWTASTTNSGYSPFLTMPFAGTLKQVRCTLDQSFLGVNVQVNGSNATPSYFVASTTVGLIPFTAGNTFSAGQKILANFGTTTTATTLEASCTFDVIETI